MTVYPFCTSYGLVHAVLLSESVMNPPTHTRHTAHYGELWQPLEDPRFLVIGALYLGVIVDLMTSRIDRHITNSNEY